MTDTSVLIVGGSLNGLTLALLLAHHNVPCILVERHAATTVQYKFRGISPRSMEIYRSLGIEGEIRGHRTGDQKSGEIARAANLASPNVQFLGKPWAEATQLSAATAETCDQDHLEPILRRHAQQLGADIRFGVELVDLEQDATGVRASVRPVSRGIPSPVALTDDCPVDSSKTEVITAAYAVACDGVAGTTRERLGVGRRGPGVLQHWMNIIFESDLSPYLEGKRFTSCFVTDINGTLVPREDRWLLALQYSPERGEKPEDFDQARTERLVRQAAGRDDVRVKLVDARSWEVSAYVADRFSAGRVFIVGDAAHTMPPTGAFGGNTGIHDAHNLAWKLALVTRGTASPSLLETYDSERRPIAEATLAQALARLAAWFKDLGARLPQTQQIIDDHAVILGQRYAHGAFIPEEGATNEVFENPRTPSGSPGSRAPHVELMQGAQAVSVHDLVGKRFLLLVGNDAKGWTDAAQAAASEFGLDLEARSLVPQNDASRSKLVEAYDIGARGAVLIRPDGVIAWRSRTDPANAPITLRNACRSILGHASWSGVVW